MNPIAKGERYSEGDVEPKSHPQRTNSGQSVERTSSKVAFVAQGPSGSRFLSYQEKNRRDASDRGREKYCIFLIIVLITTISRIGHQ